jgi:hypothetical protein
MGGDWVSVCLVGGQMCMGWDDQNFGDGMIHFGLIPCFVWFQGFEGWDEVCLSYNN